MQSSQIYQSAKNVIQTLHTRDNICRDYEMIETRVNIETGKTILTPKSQFENESEPLNK